MTISPLSPASRISVNSRHFYDVTETSAVKPTLGILVSDHCYEPRIDDLEADWVASVATPAFKLIARARPPEARRAFASIGTGSGLDALAAIEVLGARVVGVTDVHADVVSAAARNIRKNLKDGVEIALHSGYGDLLTPLKTSGARFDIIYENLPNVPLADGSDLEAARTSSTYVPPRTETVPDHVRDNLLVLHYLALVQAKDFLTPGGAVLSTLGARVPLRSFLDMADQAGFAASFLTYTWKVQADPQDIISSYAAWQHHGLGPFYFHYADDLKAAFSILDPLEAGKRALEIEEALAPKRLDAFAAFEALRQGARIGHPVAVLKSELR